MRRSARSCSISKRRPTTSPISSAKRRTWTCSQRRTRTCCADGSTTDLLRRFDPPPLLLRDRPLCIFEQLGTEALEHLPQRARRVLVIEHVSFLWREIAEVDILRRLAFASEQPSHPRHDIREGLRIEFK